MPDRLRPGTRRSKVGLYFGRRGSILVLFGGMYVMIGVGFAAIQVDRFSQPGPGGPLEFMDTVPWPGIFWIACGAVALVNGCIRRLVRNEDAFGYGALAMPPMLWTLAYTVSFGCWAFSRLAHWPQEYGRLTGFIGTGVFGMLVLVLTIISHWRDDLDGPHIEPRGSDELALLDAMVETREENAARGNRAREASEKWISESRLETERHIQNSADENARRRALNIEELRRSEDNRG